jgi:hypothetical protein
MSQGMSQTSSVNNRVLYKPGVWVEQPAGTLQYSGSMQQQMHQHLQQQQIANYNRLVQQQFQIQQNNKLQQLMEASGTTSGNTGFGSTSGTTGFLDASGTPLGLPGLPTSGSIPTAVFPSATIPPATGAPFPVGNIFMLDTTVDIILNIIIEIALKIIIEITIELFD